jgi:hypothetical protein
MISRAKDERWQFGQANEFESEAPSSDEYPLAFAPSNYFELRVFKRRVFVKTTN